MSDKILNLDDFESRTYTASDIDQMAYDVKDFLFLAHLAFIVGKNSWDDHAKGLKVASKCASDTIDLVISKAVNVFPPVVIDRLRRLRDANMAFILDKSDSMFVPMTAEAIEGKESVTKDHLVKDYLKAKTEAEADDFLEQLKCLSINTILHESCMENS